VHQRHSLKYHALVAASDLQSYVDLVDWRRRVGDLYRLARTDRLEAFRQGRDELFATHSQSPLPEVDRGGFTGLEYFVPSPELRIACRMGPPETADDVEIDTGGPDGVIRYRRAGRLRLTLEGQDCGLTVFSIVGYGGGLFVPFRDRTSGPETYGGGRYLFDTAKGAIPIPMPEVGAPLVELDFNYAYNPSCAYDHRWACPLAPQENWLPVAIRAGEKNYRAP
jgi:uncharacterized protein (DUF1684 family)